MSMSLMRQCDLAQPHDRQAPDGLKGSSGDDAATKPGLEVSTPPVFSRRSAHWEDIAPIGAAAAGAVADPGDGNTTVPGMRGSAALPIHQPMRRGDETESGWVARQLGTTTSRVSSALELSRSIWRLRKIGRTSPSSSPLSRMVTKSSPPAPLPEAMALRRGTSGISRPQEFRSFPS